MAAMTRWEYAVVVGFDRLNEWGEAGWELVGVTAAEEGERFYLKRPLPSLRERITLDQRKRVLEGGEGGDPT